MYFPEFETGTGELKALKMIPMEIRKLRLNYVNRKDAKWLQNVMDRESGKLGAGVKIDGDNTLWLEW